MLPYAHLDFAPTPAARDAAKRALSAEETSPSLSPVAVARTKAVAAGRRLTPPVMRRLAAGAEDDAVAAWARKLVAAMDDADKAAASGAAQGVVAIVLPLPAEVAEYVCLDGQPAEMHVTLACLGNAADLSPGQLAWTRMIVETWARTCPLLPATLSGVGRFAGEDADAFYLSVDAPGLSAARERLAAMLRAGAVDLASDHGFTPHATLVYLPKGAETPALPYDLPLALTFDAVEVWVAGDHGAPLALTGDADPRTMSERVDAAMASIVARSEVHGEPLPLLFADGDPPAVGHATWNQIARVGVFKGHPQGPVAFTPEVFAEAVANFDANLNGEVPGDYEHTSERLPDNTAQVGVPSPFWVTQLETRDGGSTLWAYFKWVSALAVKYVRTGEYKYVSPAINFRAKSKATGQPVGARLTSVALTNHPFIEGMQPLVADDRGAYANGTAAPAPSVLLAHVEHLRRYFSMPAAATVADVIARANDDTPATLMSPSPDSLHVSGFMPGTPPRKQPHVMDETEMKAAEAAKLAAEAAVVASADKPAEPSVEPPKPVKSFGRLCAEALGMADDASDDAVLEQVKATKGALDAATKRETDALTASAAQMADRVIAAGLADAGAKATLATLCFSSRPTFDVLYPESKLVAAEGSAKFSTAGGGITRDAATLLTSTVAAGGGAPPPGTGDTSPAMLLSARTAEIATRDKVDHFTARERAEAELSTAATAAH